jgi:site-specific DNA-adenine methylase
MNSSTHHSDYFKHLNINVERIREMSAKLQQALAMQRTKNYPEVQALHKPGDLVFFHYPERQSKLQPPYRGTFEVVSQYKNDVDVRTSLSQKFIDFVLVVVQLCYFHSFLFGTMEDF